MTAKHVADAAGRALGLLIAKSKAAGGLPYQCFSKLHDGLVQSVIDYGAAIWGVRDYSCISAVHNRAARFFLGVGRYTPNAAVWGEMGWKTPAHRQWLCVTRQWFRLCNMVDSRLTKKKFIWAHQHAENRRKNWVYHVTKFFRERQMEHLANTDYYFGPTDMKDWDMVLGEWYEHLWWLELGREQARHGVGRNKLRTNRTFKTDYEVVTELMPRSHRSALAKFRRLYELKQGVMNATVYPQT